MHMVMIASDRPFRVVTIQPDGMEKFRTNEFGSHVLNVEDLTHAKMKASRRAERVVEEQQKNPKGVLTINEEGDSVMFFPLNQKP